MRSEGSTLLHPHPAWGPSMVVVAFSASKSTTTAATGDSVHFLTTSFSEGFHPSRTVFFLISLLSLPSPMRPLTITRERVSRYPALFCDDDSDSSQHRVAIISRSLGVHFSMMISSSACHCRRLCDLRAPAFLTVVSPCSLCLTMNLAASTFDCVPFCTPGDVTL